MVKLNFTKSRWLVATCLLLLVVVSGSLSARSTERTRSEGAALATSGVPTMTAGSTNTAFFPYLSAFLSASAPMPACGTAPVVIANASNVTCVGGTNGSVTASAVLSGNPPFPTYEYSLIQGVTTVVPYQASGVFSNLAAGNYTIACREVGCTDVGFTTSTISGPTAAVLTSASGLSTSSATLNWSAATSISAYNIRYRVLTATNDAPWTSITGISSALVSRLVSGLQNNTTYEAQIQSVCAAPNTTVVSAYSASLTFTTNVQTASCVTPSSVVATTIGYTTATVTFTGTASAVCYQISYFKNGTGVAFGTGSTTTAVNNGAGVNTHTITGLTPNTDYRVSVRAVCVGTAGTGTCTPSGTTVGTQISANAPNQVMLTKTCPTAAVVNGGATTIVACGVSTLSVDNASDYTTFQWRANNADISGATSSTYTPPTSGAYYCVTTISGCASAINSQVINVSVVGGVTVSATGTNVSCNGGTNGTATATNTGGTAPYAYSWTGARTGAAISGLTAGTYGVTISDANGCTSSNAVTITEPTVISVNTTTTDVLCNGASTGAVTTSVSGGTGAYTYVWTPGSSTAANLTGAAAGTYGVLVTDANGCTRSAVATITQPAAITATLTATAVTCNGLSNGSIVATTTGGTGAHTYNWGGGITTQNRSSLAAGTYTLTTTDANGCTNVASVEVTQPAVLVAGNTGTDITCNSLSDGTLTAVATGGNGSYTYLWSNAATTAAITGLAVGTYTCTVTDLKGCTATVTDDITQPTAVTMTATGVPVACFGTNSGAVNTNVVGGISPYSFSWNTGATSINLTAISGGTYSVTVTDGNGCTKTASAIVTSPTSALVVSTFSNTNVSCFGTSTALATLTVSGGTSPYTYAWSAGGSVTNSAPNLAAGTYTVTVTDANACTLTQSYTITQPATAVAVTISASTNVLCFGNSTGAATATAAGGTGAITLTWSTLASTTSITGLAAATYTVTATDANACTATATVAITQPAAALALGLTATNVMCFGNTTGSFLVSTLSGGTTPYSYLWSNGQTAPGASGLAGSVAGTTYTLTLTDANGCTISASGTITAPAAALSATATQTNVLCYGASTGVATATIAGGTTAYTYVWSNAGSTTNTISAIAAGTYTVTVTDANACTLTQSFTITQPGVFSVTGAQTAVTCNGGTNGQVTSTITGGTGAQTYLWSNAQTTANAVGLVAGTYTITVTDASACTVTASTEVTQPAALVAGVATGSDVSCFGGSNGTIGAVATGGITAYTYNWNTVPAQTTAAATGLAAGTYTLTVTDANGCTTTVSDEITQPALLVAPTYTVVDNVCYGGMTATATVLAATSGGISPYTYAWSTTPAQVVGNATGLAATTYTVTVTDANGCTKTATVLPTQPTVIVPAATVTLNVLCKGQATGTALASATGGTGAYTFSWSTVPAQTAAGATGLLAGTYTVQVTDANGCTMATTATITEPATGVTVTGAATPVACNAGITGSVNITVTGGATPHTFNWSNGVTLQNNINVVANTYTVTVSDNVGCTITKTYAVTQPVALAVSAAATITNVTCNGAATGSINSAAAISGGTTPYTYQWSSTPIQTTETATGLVAGTYVLTVTDAKGCQNGNTFTVTQTAAMAITTVSTDVLCRGAATGAITTTYSGGTPAHTFLWSNGGNTQNISSLVAGTYTLTLTDQLSCTATATAVITQPTTAITATISSSNNVICNGGTNGNATVLGAGGTTFAVAPLYMYNWNDVAMQTTATATNLSAGTYLVYVTDMNGCVATAMITITQPAAIAANATVTNIGCSGASTGSIATAATGGTGALTYAWSNASTTASVTGLAAGTYGLTVTDATSCSKTWSYTVTAGTAIAVSTTLQQNVTCNAGTNGAINIAASGGTPGFTFNWSNAATTQNLSGLSAGTYTVTVSDAAACTVTMTYAVTQPVALVLTTTGSNHVYCKGGNNGKFMVNTAATGGVAPFVVNWSNGAAQSSIVANGGSAAITSLVAGVYNAAVVDANGCTTYSTYTVTEPATLLVASMTGSVNVSCFGGTTGSATTSATGGVTPYTYAWSGMPTQTSTTATGLIGSVVGLTYTVTITDAAMCTKTATAVITEPALLVAPTYTATNVMCFGNSTGALAVNVATSGGTSPYTYLWNDMATTTAGRSSLTGAGLVGTVYTVTVTDFNGCSKTSTATITSPNAALVVPVSVSTDDKCKTGAGGGVAAHSPTGGTTPYVYAWSNAQATAALTAVGAGVYSLTVTDANGCTSALNYTITAPAAVLSATTTVTSVSCLGGSNGGSVVTAAGGTAAYTYLWSNAATTATITGLTGSVAGITYTVTVTDINACTVSATSVITSPDALVAPTFTITDVKCFGAATGAVAINVATSGGTSPYTYLWSNAATTAAISGLTGAGVAGTTYTLTVTDAKLCTITTTAVITSPAAALTFTGATVTNDLCKTSKGSVTGGVSANGTGAHTYLWSNGETTAATTATLAAGTYTITVTDANMCTLTNSYTVTAPAVAVTVGVTGTTTLCAGATTGTLISAGVGGTGAYTYVWTSTAGYAGTGATHTGLAAATYTVTVTDGNACTATATAAITSALAMTFTSTVTNISCFGGTDGSVAVTVTNGTAPLSYNWTKNGVGFGAPNAATVTGVGVGSYAVTVTDALSCTAVLNGLTVTQPVAALTLSTTSTNVMCFGNNTGAVALSIAGGTTAYTAIWNNGSTATAGLTALVAGTYSVTVTDSKMCSATATGVVTQPAAPLAVSAVVVDETCGGTPTNVALTSDGSITTTVTGGTSAYTYSWSNGVTTASLTALNINNSAHSRTFTVTVTDANACTIAASYVVTSPASIKVGGSTNSNGTNIATYGGTITNVTCNGLTTGAITIGAVSRGPSTVYTYSWADAGAAVVGTTANLSAIPAGDYTLTITSGACAYAFGPFTVTEPNALVCDIATQTDNTACGTTGNGAIALQLATATAYITGGTTDYSYSWTKDGVTIVGTTGTSADGSLIAGASSLTALTAGTYTFNVTDANGCVMTGQTCQGIVISDVPTNTLVIAAPVIVNASCKFTGTSLGSVDGSITYAAGAVTGGTATGTGLITWAWNTGSGNLGGEIFNGAGASVSVMDLTDLAAGTYTITVTDITTNCTLTATSVVGSTAKSVPVAGLNNDATRLGASRVVITTPAAAEGGVTYDISYKTPASTVWTVIPGYTYTTLPNGTALAVNGTLNFDGLAVAGVTYTVRVRATCGGISTNWVTLGTNDPDGGGGTTLPATSCDRVTGLNFPTANITTTSARVAFTGVINQGTCPTASAAQACPRYYSIQYKKSALTSWLNPTGTPKVAHSSSGASLSYTFPTGLLASGTAYDVRVLTHCTTGTATGITATPITAVSPTVGTYNLNQFMNQVNVAINAFTTKRLAEEEASATIEGSAIGKMSVYPNPNKGQFEVSFSAENAGTATMTLTDLTGRSIYSSTVATTTGANIVPVAVDTYAKGVYLLNIKQNGTSRTMKVVLN